MGLKKGRVTKTHMFFNKKSPCQKENSLPTIIFQGDMFVFRGSIHIPVFQPLEMQRWHQGIEIHHPPAAWSMGMSLAPSPTAMVCWISQPPPSENMNIFWETPHKVGVSEPIVINHIINGVITPIPDMSKVITPVTHLFFRPFIRVISLQFVTRLGAHVFQETSKHGVLLS